MLSWDVSTQVAEVISTHELSDCTTSCLKMYAWEAVPPLLGGAQQSVNHTTSQDLPKCLAKCALAYTQTPWQTRQVYVVYNGHVNVSACKQPTHPYDLASAAPSASSALTLCSLRASTASPAGCAGSAGAAVASRCTPMLLRGSTAATSSVSLGDMGLPTPACTELYCITSAFMTVSMTDCFAGCHRVWIGMQVRTCR